MERLKELLRPERRHELLGYGVYVCLGGVIGMSLKTVDPFSLLLSLVVAAFIGAAIRGHIHRHPEREDQAFINVVCLTGAAVVAVVVYLRLGVPTEALPRRIPYWIAWTLTIGLAVWRRRIDRPLTAEPSSADPTPESGAEVPAS